MPGKNHPIWIAAALSLLLVVPGRAAVTGDAGSGGDAGDTIGTALLLPSVGTFAGGLQVLQDRDWYRAETGTEDARCARAVTSGTISADTQLQSTRNNDAQTTRLVSSHVSPGVTSNIGIALKDLLRGHHGVLGDATNVIGDYTFTLDAPRHADLGPGDGGSGGDAGSSPSTAIPVPGSCIAGTIGAGDWLDFFSFSGATGDTIVMSLVKAAGNGPIALSLVDPAGTVVETIGNGHVSEVTLTQDGSWSLATSSSSSSTTSFILGMCIPYCVLA